MPTKKPLRIAIFTDSFLPRTDGVSTATRNLALGLARRGHHIIIAAPRLGGRTPNIHPRVEILRLHASPTFFYKDFPTSVPFEPRVLKFIASHHVDIIEFQTPWTAGLQAIIISRVLRIPLVGAFHTFIAEPDYHKNLKINSKMFVPIAWKYLFLFYNACDLIICPSQQAVLDLKKNGCIRPIRLISNGIDLSLIDNSNAQSVRKRYAPQQPLFLYVGRIAHEKNILFLLRAFTALLKKHPLARLLIVGDGPQISDVRAFIAHNELKRNVILTGRIASNVLLSSGIYGAADAFVTASKTENQPMTILEAQASALPCIVVNKKSMRDLVKDGVTGFVTRPESIRAFANAMARIIDDKALATKMRHSTLLTIKSHALTNVAKETEKRYRAIIKGTQRSARGSTAHMI